MQCRILSDLHIDIARYEITNPSNADILIIAGDVVEASYIQDHLEFFEQCSTLFKKVLYVPGNHEFYCGALDGSVSFMKSVLAPFHNIHVLDDEIIELDGVLFIGSTLWTDFNRNDYKTKSRVSRSLNDYRVISLNNVRITPDIILERHQKSLKFIKDTIIESSARTFPLKIVVISHHSPSFKSTPDDYAYDNLMNGGYHSDLEKFVDDMGINTWVHGHTHHAVDYTIGDCRVICNPRGYQSRMYKEQTNWVETLTVAF